MTAKEYLTQALAIERLLAAKRRLLKKLQLQSVSLSASVSPDKVMSSNHKNMNKKKSLTAYRSFITQR